MYTFCNTDGDKQWLMTTHLRYSDVMDYFKSFVMFGNEDWPDVIVTYGKINPYITDDPLQIFTFNEDEDCYVSVDKYPDIDGCEPKFQINEYSKKYLDVALKIGVVSLIMFVSANVHTNTIATCLKAGDIHLNKIPLRIWDSLAGFLGTYGDYHCSNSRFPWNTKYTKGFSLAERVCLLKVVAREFCAEGLDYSDVVKSQKES